LAAQQLWSQPHPADKNFWQRQLIEGPGKALPEEEPGRRKTTLPIRILTAYHAWL